MAEHGNFLIGYGERLASDMAAPLGGAPKQHPYTFAESRKRLTPKVKATVRELREPAPRGLPRRPGCCIGHSASYLSCQVVLPGRTAQNLRA